jgi:hypothetical protein
MAEHRITLKNILLGKALKSNDLEKEKLNVVWGVPIMASDAVSSVAYAIEEMLLVLVPAIGLSAVGYLDFVAFPIILLFFVLAFSYSQIIDSYPNGGGAYVVCSQNIGRTPALVAASALIVGYVLTVAVSLSAATSAVLAAFPEMAPHRVPIALILLCLITLMNLRGMRESSKVFGIPTYGFILIMAALIATGFIRLATGTLSPVPPEAYAATASEGLQGVSLFLLLRAFSSGCSALTGVEVVSNAVPSFRQPAQKNAKLVLFILVGVIVFIFGGSTLLVDALKIIPTEGSTVISQMGRAVFGGGILFYVLQFATSLILLLAANTAYNGLPTLLAILAEDGYMPRQFMQRGTRLSFSNGILFIFFASGLLLVIFKANTHYLIPLYAVGVFLSFTLSQGGMVIKWFRDKDKGWRHKMVINGIGALMTGVGTAIVFLTRFAQGSWILVIVIPAICFLMHRIHKHYTFIRGQLEVDDFMEHYHRSVSRDRNLCIVLASSLSRSVLKSLNYANLITSNVVALHISTDDGKAARLKKQWEAIGVDVPLRIIKAPYRDILEPLERYISRQEPHLAPGDTISVVLVRFVQERWFDNVLHNQTTYFIEKALRRHKNVAVVIVPYIYSAKYSHAHTQEPAKQS